MSDTSFFAGMTGDFFSFDVDKQKNKKTSLEKRACVSWTAQRLLADFKKKHVHTAYLCFQTANVEI